MPTAERALTGAVEITYDQLTANIAKVGNLLLDLDEARTHLEKITRRPVRQAWSAVPSLVSFASEYVDACATTIAIIDTAELKVVGMADALRVFADSMQLQDQTALDALSALERSVDNALAPTPLPTPDVDANGRTIKTHMHQQPV